MQKSESNASSGGSSAKSVRKRAITKGKLTPDGRRGDVVGVPGMLVPS